MWSVIIEREELKQSFGDDFWLLLHREMSGVWDNDKALESWHCLL